MQLKVHVVSVPDPHRVWYSDC